MLNVFLFILTIALISVSIFLILIVLSQKAKSDGGVGAAMGGGMAEAAFGAETNSVLTKLTIGSAVLFFVLSLTLYLGRLAQQNGGSDGVLPTVGGLAPAAMPIDVGAPGGLTAPAAGAPEATAPSSPATGPVVPAAPAAAPAAPAAGDAK